MEKIVNKDYWGRTDEYEIVNEFPEGYVIWNIGRGNFDQPCFVPLAKPDPDREFGIIRTGLKALKVESESLALYVMDQAIKGDRVPEDKKWFDKVVKRYNRLYSA